MTFSLVCLDPRSGSLAVATATGKPAVGAYVPHVLGGVGAIATQGYSTNRFYGLDGLELLGRGWTATEALEALTGRDRGRDRRQCIVIDAEGRGAVFTGEANEAVIAEQAGDRIVMAGNMLASSSVIDAMAEAHADFSGSLLLERVLSTMEAGEQAGGDKRGTCSAALLIEEPDGQRLDLRIDYDPYPLDALRRLVERMREPAVEAFRNRVPTRADPHRG